VAGKNSHGGDEMSDKARTVSERAVRKASRKRLLEDMERAAAWVRFNVREAETPEQARQWLLEDAQLLISSRTRYACLMTAFGQ